MKERIRDFRSIFKYPIFSTVIIACVVFAITVGWFSFSRMEELSRRYERLEYFMTDVLMTLRDYERTEVDLKRLHQDISELRTTVAALETTTRQQSEIISFLEMRLEKGGY